ncbi:tRNA isopentenyl-2-thiomethyl-A-37 hydroxylase MiaE [Shewanella eurypsychrophilus]|uniref:tRNA isopentenyl-2-thiomethyl-A-37 hydroxylase MiaE n=1 Tax=Shewanella eurypsychrophilus TaxID=2593656 RepID=A0ABX6V3U5_9GAMM|nr:MULTISPECIES: tRNA isopentenyl-2-thiomethyl-A-37 hydroxylase MiaE [Shewanella]QFU22018.1 tRNA-(ms[2]io[6]A)-hydroxylase [Shewanella sp. YLB-09]QPG57308.1 tRNA isopentenyl-2-thiomethyl-A-37 hydroxylase MiaE [Shewanella eurypsychrophilus]
MQQLLAPIHAFLGCETPDAWIEVAKRPESLTNLLIDHCNCELKAAQTAMSLIRKYAVDKESAQLLLAWAKPYEEFIYQKDRNIESFLSRDSKKNDFAGELVAKPGFEHAADLISKMVRLIKEEFHHFEQVLEIMHKRDIPYQNITAGRYAKGMMKQVRTHEPAALVDKLIIGAFIEARSCERFAKLAPYLDNELNRFYVSLLRSEARHYQDYLVLAEMVQSSAMTKKSIPVNERVEIIRHAEAALILSSDPEFKFHSGAPEV